MRLRVIQTDLFVTECPSRLPFKFGSVTLDRATLCLARMQVQAGPGPVIEGFASDLLVPKWFEKNPAKSPREDAEDLLRSAMEAGQSFAASGSELLTVFESWMRTHEDCVLSRPPDSPDLLVKGFGVALFERALMDAACRAAGLSLADAIRQDLFSFRPAEILPGLAGWDIAASLPARPQKSVLVRHTVGMLDPLRVADVPEGARISDGLPQALEEDIERYGLRRFKVKIGGGHANDVRRLLDLAQLFDERDMGPVSWTADGNEQFEDMQQLLEVLQEVATHTKGIRLLKDLEFIEQPLAREKTFDEGSCAAMSDVQQFAPVIIDEADTNIDSFPRARELDYAGVSVKNCKGVFRALLNRGLCERSEGACFQTAEDLTNLGGIPLQQNLATIAALGFAHAELNGHHYFRGLDHLPESEIEAATAAHPDLYGTLGDTMALKIHNGRIAMDSIQCPGFGYAFPVLAEERTPAERWLSEGGS